MKHTLKHVRGGTWTICHPNYGLIYQGLISRAEATRVAAALDEAKIDYTTPNAAQQINAIARECRNA